MAFKSLFIGVDRYESPLVSNLSCSVRDAQALHGLFGDAFGVAESTLLANEEARGRRKPLDVGLRRSLGISRPCSPTNRCLACLWAPEGEVGAAGRPPAVAPAEAAPARRRSLEEPGRTDVGWAWATWHSCEKSQSCPTTSSTRTRTVSNCSCCLPRKRHQ
jgi:hypothetical protein